MRAAEGLAIEHGRTLLVLDTAEEDGAAKLYERTRLPAHRPDPGLRAEAAWRPHRAR